VTDSPSGLDDSVLYDAWRHPSGDTVYMPSSSREQYARLGWTLLAEQAWDYQRQMRADGVAARNRGLTSDYGSPTGPTAPFPAS
jgi:hypothetical protein